MEVANTDDTHGNPSSACNLPVIYSYEGIASRRERNGESVLFMLAKMFQKGSSDYLLAVPNP